MIYSQFRQFSPGGDGSTSSSLVDNNIKDMQNFSFKEQTRLASSFTYTQQQGSTQCTRGLGRMARAAAAAMMAAAEALKHAVAPNECPFFLLFVHPYKVDGTAMMLLDES